MVDIHVSKCQVSKGLSTTAPLRRFVLLKFLKLWTVSQVLLKFNLPCAVTWSVVYRNSRALLHNNVRARWQTATSFTASSKHHRLLGSGIPDPRWNQTLGTLHHSIRNKGMLGEQIEEFEIICNLSVVAPFNVTIDWIVKGIHNPIWD